MAPGNNATSIFFILGPSYHGAPLISWRLNNHPDILSLGSANPLRHEDPPVSDGTTVSTSPFWRKMVEAIDSKQEDPIDNMLPQMPFIVGNEKLNKVLNIGLSMLANEIGPGVWKAVFESANRFIVMYERFFAAAREWIPHKALLDGERSNMKFMVLASMGFPVKGVIHLVRDPRGYVAAWKKYYPESTVETLTLEWAAAHARIYRLATSFQKMPFLTLRYEDLMEKPEETFHQAVAFMGLPRGEYVEIAVPGKDNLLGLGPQDRTLAAASVAGNWRETLSPEEEARILKVAGPLFSEFGYKSEILP